MSERIAELRVMDEQTVKLAATVKRLIRETKDPREAAIKLSLLGNEAVSILCSLTQIEGRRRNCLRWCSLGLTLLGIGINLILIVTVPRESRQLYQVLATSIYGVGAIATALLYGGANNKASCQPG